MNEMGQIAARVREEYAAAMERAHLSTVEANARGEGHKEDAEKPRWDLLPLGPVEDIVAVLTLGARKYADDNWQKVPNAERRYFAAFMRHVVARMKGEINDPESGYPHLAHAGCCLLFMAWFDRENKKP